MASENYYAYEIFGIDLLVAWLIFYLEYVGRAQEF
jgi:hypothetical protein